MSDRETDSGIVPVEMFFPSDLLRAVDEHAARLHLTREDFISIILEKRLLELERDEKE